MKKVRWFRVFLLFLIISIIIFLYGMLIAAKKFEIHEYKVESEYIKEEYNGLKIVHISDIHYGTTIKKKHLDKIINEINKLKPDLVFFLGDLIDYKLNSKQHKEIVDSFSKLEAKLGKYAVSGNHDYYYKKWNELIDEMGFYNLNDTYVEIYNNSHDSIFIAGISDNLHTTKNIEDKSEAIFEYLNNSEATSNIYNILLIHEPDYIEKIDYNKFNLILSGHSHNGQVRLPLIGPLYTPPGSKKYIEEYYLLNKTELYISNGLGTTLLPIRLFNNPSFNLYRLTKKWN